MKVKVETGPKEGTITGSLRQLVGERWWKTLVLPEKGLPTTEIKRAEAAGPEGPSVSLTGRAISSALGCKGPGQICFSRNRK